MIGLRRWLAEHDDACEALEVDFTQFFNGADFRAAMWGGPGVRWSPRRLMAHVHRLEHIRDSAYRLVLYGQQGAADPVPRLLAALINAVRLMDFNQIRIGSPDSIGRGEEPVMIELPELEGGLVEPLEQEAQKRAEEDRPFASAGEIAAWLSARR